MDLDVELVRSVLRGGRDAYLECVNRDIDPEIHLAGNGKVAWEFLTEAYKTHGDLPPLGGVSAALGIDLSGSSEGAHGFYLEEIMKRRLFVIQKEGIKEVSESLEKRDPQGAAEAWQEIHRKIQRESLTVRKVENLLALARLVKADYLDAKDGKRGIPTPWPAMDDQTLGWWPEDLILFVGRLGVGKTWILVQCAHRAWQMGHKVLIVSTEMNKRQMARRFFALHLKMPYNEVRRGKLGEFAEKKFFEGLDELMVQDGINIIAGDFDYSIDNVGATVEDEKPDLLCIDGPYLIKNSGKDRHERVSNNFDDFKKLGKRTGVSTITNLQFNRSAKTGQDQTISADNIGITDVAGWNADVAYGMMQSEEMKSNARLSLKALKIREGQPDTFEINWNHSTMDFSEVGDGSPPPVPDPSGGGGDAVYADNTTSGDSYDDVPF
jgi:replicative DNA helicase